jgi:hypothetical protein
MRRRVSKKDIEIDLVALALEATQELQEEGKKIEMKITKHIDSNTGVETEIIRVEGDGDWDE